MMNILVVTNHLADFAGSETVAIEVASTFKELGCKVQIVAAYIDEPMRSYLIKKEFSFCTLQECPDIHSFDIIWSQHQVFPHMLSKQNIDSLNDIFLITATLSPFEPFEMPGAIAEISDLIVANSQETADHIANYGVDKNKTTIFYNAAPDEYIRNKTQAKTLKKLLIISNHVPQELFDAADILKNQNIIVDHIGLPINKKKVTPEIIASYDAIVSIGKSVQYAVLSETPIYIYDRFGGPGWLSEDNINLAEQFNFSGRCCNRHLTSSELADEIIEGFQKATTEVQNIKASRIGKYSLHLFLKSIIDKSLHKIKNKKIDNKDINLTLREGIVNGRLIDFYIMNQNHSQKISDLLGQNNQYVNEIIDLRNKYDDEISVLLSKNKEIEDKNKEIENKNKEMENQNKEIINKNNETIINLVNEANVLILRMEKLAQSRSWLFKRYLKYLKYLPRDLSRKIRGKAAPKKNIPIDGVTLIDVNKILPKK